MAEKNNPEAIFINDDVGQLTKINGKFNLAIYSHVIEMLSSPEGSLIKARKIADKIIIRFFEPPVFEYDTVELKEMEVSRNIRVPYLRRKMSNDYYRMILQKIGCKKVDIYKDKYSKDQIHVLNY